MNLFEINPSFLEKRLPNLDLDYAKLVTTLNLDLAHLQLINDCYQHWRKFDLSEDFWLYMLLLVDEINRGSSCLDLSSHRFRQHQNLFNLPDFSDLEMVLSQLTLADNPVIIHHQDYLYFEKYFYAEQTLYRQIDALINNYQGSHYNQSAIQAVLKSVLQTLSYPLNKEQIQAVITGLIKSFSLVSGGPGTGKTTIVTSLLRCLNLLGVSVQDMALAAPTGRAAYRMTESLQLGINQALTNRQSKAVDLEQLEAQTIHRLIGKTTRFNQSNRYHENHKLPFKVIVIDEVSMVDLQLMTELLAAVDRDCRLILVGDQFQLPSVESGAVLADLMPPANRSLSLSPQFAKLISELMAPYVNSKKEVKSSTEDEHQGLLVDSCTVLKQSHRSIEAIQNLSECVRVGDAAGFFSHPDLITFEHVGDTVLQRAQGVIWLSSQQDTKNSGLDVIWRWFNHHINLKQYKQVLAQCQHFKDQDINQHRSHLDSIFQHIYNQQILTLLNQGVAGQQIINQYICQQIKQQWHIDLTQNHFHGQVVMMRHNDYDKQLFNGDVGVLLDADDGWRAVFPGTTGYRSFLLPLLSELATAFAITVHKSQGSEYQHVLMPMPGDINNRLLTREIVYTGMTRAKSSVVIYGTQAILSKAIESYSERHSGLQFW